MNRDLSKAEKYLLMADKDSGYACYYLGKLYQEEEIYDIDKAVSPNVKRVIGKSSRTAVKRSASGARSIGKVLWH